MKNRRKEGLEAHTILNSIPSLLEGGEIGKISNPILILKVKKINFASFPLN